MRKYLQGFRLTVLKSLHSAFSDTRKNKTYNLYGTLSSRMPRNVQPDLKHIRDGMFRNQTLTVTQNLLRCTEVQMITVDILVVEFLL